MELAKKWQGRWEKEGAFHAVPDKRPKFFCNFPYPYINAYQHVGHLFTLMRVEALARYKRLKGYNVLFPQGWHVTGSPIVQAAKRVKDKEPKQLKIMKDMGITDIKKFEDPENWIKFFAPEFKKDYQSVGMSIDWRREFHTSELNPRYDKFIKWQFRKLKEKDLVIEGEFPVVWDPKENHPVGDHDRVEGEGETPQEMVLVKHKLSDGRFLISATLRPDTILGVTNLYVHPGIEYAEAIINGEKWILGSPALKRLQEQGQDIKPKGKVKGSELIGQEVQEFAGTKVPVLPATFLSPDVGTGLVHSVPSESADDLIALQDLQKDEALCKKHGLDPEKVRKVKPVPILKTEYGDNSAQALLDKYGVKHQGERKKLEEIRKELYKMSHYSAVFNEKYKGFHGQNLAGKKVHEGKDAVKKVLVDKGWAVTYYELTGKVVSRSLTECIVKIVDDQWFINYNDPKWKKEAHKALKQLKLYPEKARSQFEYVVDWLHEWACTREGGLGTRLPWDEKWLIESLSDSTIYMAYYTIVHLLNEVPLDDIDDALFDYVLHGKGKSRVKGAEAMRKEFEYWYPVDFRNSGKDLIQNHLTFFIFNHTAIFPEKHWPKGIGVNGWVTVDGQKMSKSLGNMIPVRDVVGKYGPDACRLTMLSGGEGMDDPNWDSKMAESLPSRLSHVLEFCKDNHGKGRSSRNELDAWAESKLHRTIRDATAAMEETMFRTAIQKVFFEYYKTMRAYTARGANKDVMKELLESFVVMLSPFAPHTCEEAWEQMGKKGFVSLADWPKHDPKKISDEAEAAEELLSTVRSDVKRVLELAKIKYPEEVTLFLAEDWKYGFVKKIKQLLGKTRDPKAIIGEVMKSPLKKHGQDVMKLIPGIVKDPSKLPEVLVARKDEEKKLKDSLKSLEEEFCCKFSILEKNDDPKASKAMPGKPAILAR